MLILRFNIICRHIVLGDFIGRMIEEEEREDFLKLCVTPEYIGRTNV